MIFGLPWWVLVMIICIVISGYMAVRAIQAERSLEQAFIEREGNVYMDRIEAARHDKEEGRQRQQNVN
ncbi:hypothetical protein J2Z83_001078 [Virgibacillus natechei]|uniref:SigE-dependent sporulation protein n=1 Tax=Virgibacillus natechei TaxID=1216297 RepID=A0ABS4IEC8_9BACI|nr:sporulation YhaL family protein [Virgibacillus natechei]MBP1968975.1 hypothetical protein [Virgibacillus natechei]UZD14253.1 sporulation YhaL family protein [Virgibacillus natechei]